MVLIRLSKAKARRRRALCCAGNGGRWPQRRRSGNSISANSHNSPRAPHGRPMTTEAFSTACLRNPVNGRHCGRIIAAGAAGCLDRLRLPRSDGLECPDFARRSITASTTTIFSISIPTPRGRPRIPSFANCRAGCSKPVSTSRCESGARPSLVSGKAPAALPGAAMLDARHRPLPDQSYPGRDPPPRWRSRCLCAEWIRRYRRHDRPAQSRTEFLGRQL